MTWGDYIDEEVEEAFKIVREEALAKGREEEKFRLLIKLVKDGAIPVQTAAKEADMSVKDFEEKFL